MAELIEIGTLSEDASEFLQNCIGAKLNILISGGTGSGKTTFLNALSEAVPDSDRIVTIEDAAELQLNQRHVLRLESRPKNIEGEGEITIRDLVRNALRMRPDRIIVGEVRGAETLDMLQAMNTGHEGSLSTVHANSPRDALNRLETMVLMAGYELPVRAIRSHVSSASTSSSSSTGSTTASRGRDLRSPAHGGRGDHASEAVRVQDRPFRRRSQDRRRLHPTGLRPGFLGKFERHGIEPLGLFGGTSSAIYGATHRRSKGERSMRHGLLSPPSWAASRSSAPRAAARRRRRLDGTSPR